MLPKAVAYRRRDFEQQAMIRELCCRNGVVLPPAANPDEAQFDAAEAELASRTPKPDALQPVPESETEAGEVKVHSLEQQL